MGWSQKPPVVRRPYSSTYGVVTEEGVLFFGMEICSSLLDGDCENLFVFVLMLVLVFYLVGDAIAVSSASFYVWE
jgi:hypothetical protein